MMNDRSPQPDAEPPDAFWENELEMPVAALRATAESDDFMTEWLAERNGAQVAMFRHLLGMPGNLSTQAGRESLETHLNALRPSFLVQRFARNKTKAAVIDFAERRLSAETVALATSGDSYDTSALISAIYHRDWRDLALLYQFEQIYRKGFARTRLTERLKRPATPVSEFLSEATLKPILAAYDDRIADGRVSQFKSRLQNDGTDLVFIRRADRPTFLMQGTAIVHGFAPEWIILDFRDGASRVDICSDSRNRSLEIANAIASAYYNRPCEYENERITTYPQQLRRLIDQLVVDHAHGLTLAEVRVRNSPLDGGPKVVLSADGAQSVAPSIRQFGEALSPLLTELDSIDAMKVLYADKRVSLILDDGSKDDAPLPSSPDDQAGRPVVVRYTDRVLTPKERAAFERLMEEVHGITVVSTEKKFRH
jgi:hypothetical protein